MICFHDLDVCLGILFEKCIMYNVRLDISTTHGEKHFQNLSSVFIILSTCSLKKLINIFQKSHVERGLNIREIESKVLKKPHFCGMQNSVKIFLKSVLTWLIVSRNWSYIICKILPMFHHLWSERQIIIFYYACLNNVLVQ